VIATLANITFAGPDPMMDSVEAALTRLGVSLANIESERYNFI
jgi:predicted ferric reductase